MPDKFNRVTRDEILKSPVDMKLVNEKGWAELNVGWPLSLKDVCRSAGNWRTEYGHAVIGHPYVSGMHDLSIAPIPTASELCDPANELNKVVRDASGNVVPPPGWRIAVDGDAEEWACAVNSSGRYNRAYWDNRIVDTFKGQPDKIHVYIVPINPHLPPFAPLAWPEFDGHRERECTAPCSIAASSEGNAALLRLLHVSELSAMRSEMDRRGAEIERLERENALCATTIKDVERHRTEDALRISDLTSSLASARADAEKLRDAMGRANDTIEEMQLELATWRAGKALNAELAKTREEFPTIPDPTKEADRGDAKSS